jgi:di/tricarboxylate transporter
MALYLTFGIILVGIFLFVKDYFTIDTTSLLIMALFIVTGVLTPEEGFSGFIHPATVTLSCMFVLSAAIFKSGIIDGLSTYIIRLARIHYLVALATFSCVTALLSAFINDSAVVAIMIPMALLVCKETGIDPSKLLIPISFAACFGGACTLIGTSANILISSYAEKSGLEPFGMFELTKAALVLSGVGFIYLFVVAPYLLPKRKANKEGGLIYEAENYVAEIVLLANCPDVNKELKKSKLLTEFKAQILSINRDSRLIENFTSDFIFIENDRLKILLSPNNLLNLKHSKGYKVKGDVVEEVVASEKPVMEQEAEELPEADAVLIDPTKRMYEILVPIDSRLAGSSLKQLNFRNVYRASVLAIRNRNETIFKNLSDVKLKEGDMLLLYASEQELNALTSQKQVIVMSNFEKKRINYKKAIPALLIAAGVITAAALNLTSILMSGMIGCLLLVSTSILKPQEAYEAIDWKVIFMIAGVLSMGMALEKTGGAVIISETIFNAMGQLDPRITLSLIFLITFLSTNILSGKAAAALMAPIVISLASILQVSERPFLVAVMFACAFTFMTPLSNPTNAMVYVPGKYKFADYLKIGTPLNIIIWLVASFTIPLFFPF